MQRARSRIVYRTPYVLSRDLLPQGLVAVLLCIASLGVIQMSVQNYGGLLVGQYHYDKIVLDHCNEDNRISYHYIIE